MFGGTEDRMGISTQHVPDCPLGIVFVFASNCIYNYYRELLPKSREYNAEGLAQGIARSVIRNIETSVSSMRPPADSCQARNKDFFQIQQNLGFWALLPNIMQPSLHLRATVSNLDFCSLTISQLAIYPRPTPSLPPIKSSLLSSPEEQR